MNNKTLHGAQTTLSSFGPVSSPCPVVVPVPLPLVLSLSCVIIPHCPVVRRRLSLSPGAVSSIIGIFVSSCCQSTRRPRCEWLLTAVGASGFRHPAVVVAAVPCGRPPPPVIVNS
jgi:hypothetical protein